MKEKIKLPSSLLEHTPWETPTNSIWPATTFLLHRNLSKIYFPSKMHQAQMQQTLNINKDFFLKNTELKNPQFLKAEELAPLDKEYLFEHFLCKKGFQNSLEGQGFIVDASYRFLGMLNIEDHVQLQLMDCTGDWESTWNQLWKIETDFSAKIDYAFSSRFGYLTSDLSTCGTGLEIYSYLHVPALIHTGALKEILLKQKEEPVMATGLQGTLDDLVGDFIVLRNLYTLGISEEAILRTSYSMSMHLMNAENSSRKQLQQEKNTHIKDLISRAYGLLLHSFQLQTKEALSHLSLIKLGVALGWIEGISDKELNQLFFTSRRAHLSFLYQQEGIDSEKLLHLRATYLQERLKNVALMI